ncbi:uncharacterized protein LOC112555268 isoform X2 [Pomacea canaliculata]|uniref:uncharacterized protein LOC112555268 isoform X2 n=1 Tax=Pomacea canaliculata TaxID=400727 RepID=UPI000D72BE3D|nr:uncharacterized protein LOC112555268 isoform X2 [Pomacea canaliculata]
MAIWSVRRTGYKVGVAVLSFGALVYVTGFLSPLWVDTSHGDTTFSQGLWLECAFAQVASQCSSLGLSAKYVPGWLKAVQALQCIGCIAMLGALAYHVVIDCCMTAPPEKRVASIAFIGAMLYVDRTRPYVSQFYSWAFALDVAGCLLVILGAILILKNNALIPDPTLPPNAITLSQLYDHGQPIRCEEERVQHTSLLQSPLARHHPLPSSPSHPGGPGGHPAGCVALKVEKVSIPRKTTPGLTSPSHVHRSPPSS